MIAVIEYDGTEFLGWQSQSQGLTVQGCLEKALSFVANQPVAVVCSGRTDSGVHGFGQVVHFDGPERPDRAWMLGANSRLPRSVAIRHVQQVPDEFHARYSALARRYRYSLLNRPARPGLHHRTLAWERIALDVAAMQEAAQSLVGELDFSSFRSAACQAKRPQRRMDEISIERGTGAEHEVIHFTLQANAFLHHMVRNIVGSLACVGRAEQPVSWIADVLAAKDRSLAAATAQAGGLVFLGPRYPQRFGLPSEFCAKPELELWIPPFMREENAAEDESGE